MQYRTLGNTSIQISEIGLGCWQLGGDFGPITETQVKEILTTAMAQKVTFWDTADVYGGGQSEAYIGEFLRDLPEKQRPFLATKYGRWEGTYPDTYSLTSMRDLASRSRDRLQMDALDLLQLHCVPTAILKRGEIFDWLRTLRQEGLIKHFGASVETVEEALICTEQSDITSIQVIFNVFRQRLLDELFPRTLENNIAVIVRLPLASGLLSGKFSKHTQFAATDHRHYNRNGEAFSVGETFAGIDFHKGLELVETLRPLVPETITLAQFALRWILDHEAVTTVIAGVSTPEQLQRNTEVSTMPALSAQLHERLRDFYRKDVHPHIRGVY